MQEMLIPKLCALTIASIWTCGRPNSCQGARRYGPEIPAAQTSPKLDRLSSDAVLGVLFSFPMKPMNTKVGYNFVEQNPDTEFALFGVRAWQIWRRQ
jgi:hypothetical protein